MIDTNRTISVLTYNGKPLTLLGAGLDSSNYYTKEEVDAIKTYILNFKEILALSFGHNAPALVAGDTLTAIDLYWSCNKVPQTLMIQNNATTLHTSKPTAQAGFLSVTGSFTKDNATFVLVVVDEENFQDSLSATVPFANYIYYGVSNEANLIDPDAIKNTFTPVLTYDRKLTAQVQPNNEYIYFYVPDTYGNCTFSAYDNEGGFELLTNTIQIQNNKGYSEYYKVYRSVHTLTTDEPVEIMVY